MNLYTPGQRVIAKVPWAGTSKMRNCRLVEELLPGFWTVQVFSNWTQTYYTDVIEIAESDITPMSSMVGCGPRRHLPFVPNPP